MTIPPNESAFWRVAIILAAGGVLSLMLHILYSHGFVLEKDGPTVLAVVTALGGLEAVHRLFGDKKPEPPKP